jgi:hypothetical protein
MMLYLCKWGVESLLFQLIDVKHSEDLYVLCGIAVLLEFVWFATITLLKPFRMRRHLVLDFTLSLCLCCLLAVLSALEVRSRRRGGCCHSSSCRPHVPPLTLTLSLISLLSSSSRCFLLVSDSLFTTTMTSSPHQPLPPRPLRRCVDG